jgi:hypothetical protein
VSAIYRPEVIEVERSFRDAADTVAATVESKHSRVSEINKIAGEHLNDRAVVDRTGLCEFSDDSPGLPESSSIPR